MALPVAEPELLPPEGCVVVVAVGVGAAVALGVVAAGLGVVAAGLGVVAAGFGVVADELGAGAFVVVVVEGCVAAGVLGEFGVSRVASFSAA